MSVAVYPRLGELLRESGLNVAELKRRIEQRFGLPVDAKTLYWWTYSEPVQRADLQIAGAVAEVLGVPLGDLFRIEAVRVDPTDEAEVVDLSPQESRRMAELFDRQAYGALSDVDEAELQSLVIEYGRRLHERRP